MQLDAIDRLFIPVSGDVDSFMGSSLALPFEFSSVAFVDQLSSYLMAHCQTPYPDLYALGFWFRNSHIKALQDRVMARSAERGLYAKGLVFQIAPGNVDTLFLYSGLLAFLMGNRVAIRVSSRQSEQFLFLLDVLNQILQTQPAEVQDRWLIFACEHDSDWIQQLSRACDIRVLWGADETIQALRRHALRPAAKELSFAQRHSLTLINAHYVLTAGDLNLALKGFETDIFSFSQQACSSPKCLVWQGDEATVTRARELFWQAAEARMHADQLPEELMIKYESMQEMAVQAPISITQMKGRVFRADIGLKDLDARILDRHPGYGLLLEARISDLAELPQCLQLHYQTLSYLGYAKTDFFSDPAFRHALFQKLDRLVPLGKANEFDEIWDGVDLLHEFCRVVRIPSF